MSEPDDTDEDATSPEDAGSGFIACLTLIFLVAKLTGAITWSWWWVFSPLWIPTALAVAIIGAALGVFLVIWVIAMLAALIDACFGRHGPT